MPRSPKEPQATNPGARKTTGKTLGKAIPAKTGRKTGPRTKASPTEAKGNESLREWAAQIQAHGERQGMTPQDICQALDITRSYFNVFRRGSPQGVEPGRDILRRSADFLGVSVVQAFMMAGVLAPQDFYLHSTLEGSLDKALSRMRADDEWVSYLPTQEQWKDMDLNMRVGIVLLYERATYNIHRGAFKALLDHIEIEVSDQIESDRKEPAAPRRRKSAT